MSAKDLALGQGQVKALPGRKGEQGPKGDPGTDGLPGPPGPNGESVRWRGKWTASGSYRPLDAVEFEGSSYICTDSTSARPPGFGWDLMAQKGKDGGAGNAQLVKGFGAIGGAGGGVAIGASNTTYTSGTVVFSGNGNVTVATNGQTVLISAAGAVGGGIGAVANSETTYTSGTVALSGLGNVTVRSTTGNAFQISVPAQSVQAETQTFLSGVGNSQTTYTSGNVLLSGLGAVTIDSTTGQAFRINVPVQSVQVETQTFLSGIGNSQTTYTSGTVNLSVEGGAMTIRSTTGQAFRFSISQSVQAETQTFVGGVAMNAATTYTSGTVVLSAGANITLGSNAQTITISGVAAQTTQTQNMIALTLSGNTSGALAGISSGTLTLVGGNNITLSQAGNVVTISGPNAGGAQTAISGLGNSETTYTSGTVNLSALANITIRSTTGNAFQFSVAAPGAGIALAATNTTYTSGTVVISATGGLQLSTNGQTISLGVPDLVMSTFGNLRLYGNANLTSTNATASTRSLFVFPFHPYDPVFPADITASTMRMLASISEATTASNMAAMTLSAGLAIYRISGSASASTLSLLNSASWSFGSGGTMGSTFFSQSVSGIRWMTIHSSQWSSSPVFTEGGNYVGAYFSSTAGPAVGSWALYGASHSTMNISGAIGAASVSNTTVGLPNWAGVYSATTAAFPASIHLNQLNRQVGMAAFVPLIEIDQNVGTH